MPEKPGLFRFAGCLCSVANGWGFDGGGVEDHVSAVFDASCNNLACDSVCDAEVSVLVDGVGAVAALFCLAHRKDVEFALRYVSYVC